MMRRMKIDQALHGYSNGHRLICASSKVNDSDAKKMTILSDLSGNEFVKGFEKYYTGYRLDDDRLVIACTWYAHEMQRPGCVWTHSLIINPEELKAYKRNSLNILSLFRRPYDNDFSYYKRQLEVSVEEEIEIDSEKLKYITWCIWGNKNPIIIFEDMSSEYENEILYLFLTQNDLLKKTFTFCTGSISLRSYNNNIMNLQVAPRKIAKSKFFIDNSVSEAKEYAAIRNYPVWVRKTAEHILNDGLYEFENFWSVFSEKYKEHDYFSAFIKLFVGSKAENKEASLFSLLEIAIAVFDDKKEICQEITTLYIRGYFKYWMAAQQKYVRTLEFFCDNPWMDWSIIDIHEMVKNSFSNEYLESKKLFKKSVYVDETKSVELILKSYSDIVPMEKFVDFTDLEYELCGTLLSLNQKYALCEKLWEQNIVFQRGMIKCLRDDDNNDKNISDVIIETVLRNSKYDLTMDLYKVYKEKCFPYFWKCVLDKKDENRFNSMKSILKLDVSGGVQVLKNNLEKREDIMVLITCINSYSSEIKKLTLEEIEKVYITVKHNENTRYEDEILARFLVPLCFMREKLLPIYIARFVFSIVNELLANQQFPENEWEELEKMLPQIAQYHRWDRCKRLRKGFKKKGYALKEIQEKDIPVYLL